MLSQLFEIETISVKCFISGLLKLQGDTPEGYQRVPKMKSIQGLTDLQELKCEVKLETILTGSNLTSGV